MKSYVASLLVLAAASLSVAMPTLETRQAISRTPNGPPEVGKGSGSNSGKKCIKFTSDNNNWHYANTGVWGDATGTFGSTGGQICVPYTTTGGAMYIGPVANPSSNDTKLECFFPTDSSSSSCDMSIVNGYSLSVTCTSSGVSFGGGIDLWTQGNPCPDTTYEKSEGVCVNDIGPYTGNPNAVKPFFKAGTTNGNNYCTYTDCPISTVPTTAEMTCHVSGTNKVGQ